MTVYIIVSVMHGHTNSKFNVQSITSDILTPTNCAHIVTNNNLLLRNIFTTCFDPRRPPSGSIYLLRNTSMENCRQRCAKIK